MKYLPVVEGNTYPLQPTDSEWYHSPSQLADVQLKGHMVTKFAAGVALHINAFTHFYSHNCFAL